MYAIIEDSGTQIKVTEGDVLDLDLRSDAKAGDKLTLDRVLMIGGTDSDATLGVPFVNGASVAIEIIDQIRGEKINVIKFRRRKGYHRKNGHRQNYLRVKVTGITTG